MSPMQEMRYALRWLELARSEGHRRGVPHGYMGEENQPATTKAKLIDYFKNNSEPKTAIWLSVQVGSTTDTVTRVARSMVDAGELKIHRRKRVRFFGPGKKLLA